METENLCEERRTQNREKQTDRRPQGQVPRLSQANLFTLLSLWMETFPRETPEDHDPGIPRPDHDPGVRPCGLVVVLGGRVRGLHVSGPLLHAGQEAVLRHGGAGLEGSQLYFSRRPCSTCLKMVVNAGVSQVFFWPGDPEVSVLPGPGAGLSPEALLDLRAVERLRVGGGPPVAVVLRPLAPGLPQYVDLKSRTSDFMERVQEDQPEQDLEELFRRQRKSHLQELSRAFLIPCEREHRAVLELLGLEAFCQDPDLSTLRSNMLQLVELLASVSAGLPLLHHGFYCSGDHATPRAPTPPLGPSEESPDRAPRRPPVSQDVAPRGLAPPPVSQDVAPSGPAPPPVSQDVAPRGPAPPPVSQDVAPSCPAPPPVSQDVAPSGPAPPPVSQDVAPSGPAPPPVSQDVAPSGPAPPPVSQDVARHCIIQAMLLAYRTEDPKVGVGAVIWAEGESAGGDGTGPLYLVGCGYNAYPVGSQYAQYPQLDTKHPDRGRTKYRYIIHAEQNALTFRSRQALPGQRLLLFVTKCPCDECVPLIRAAGVTHVFTSDQDAGKDKGDISYLRFRGPAGPARLIWQKRPLMSLSLTNGCVGKRRGSPSDQERTDDKRLRLPDLTPDP